MTTSYKNLQKGDIAYTRFPAAQVMTDKRGREIGLVGERLTPHPVVVLSVDAKNREGLVMLLGSERDGNRATNLALSRNENFEAKLPEGVRGVYKPQNLAIVPLEELRHNGGHLSNASMQRIERAAVHAMGEKSAHLTHLSRDGQISLYDVSKKAPGRVILEAPSHAAEAGNAISRAASTTSNAETVVQEASRVRRAAEIAEVAGDVAKFAAREGVKVLSGGPIGDAMAVADVAMAGFGFIDNHTGHAISQGPIGKGVEYVGEHTGAFKAAHEVAEKAQPYIDQAHRIADPVVERVANTASLIADKTGLTAATHHVEHVAGVAAGATLDWSAQQIANVQRSFSEITRAAGFDTPPLTHDEARAVAHGMANAQPGEAVALHQSGSMELLSANANHVPSQPGTLILDAQSFKEQMGLAAPTRAATQVAQLTPPPPAREMMH